MNILRLSVLVVPLIACSTIPLTAATPSPAAALSPSEILAKSVAAYDHLQSYHCHTSVVSPQEGGKTITTTADITFVRRVNIRVDGIDLRGNRYTFFTKSGKAEVYCNGKWKHDVDPENAVATVTGISLDAATTVPALLLHTMWGCPFYPQLPTDSSAPTEIVAGQTCWRVTAPTNGATFWIDQKTFLIDKSQDGCSVPADTQTVTDQHVNTPQTVRADW